MTRRDASRLLRWHETDQARRWMAGAGLQELAVYLQAISEARIVLGLWPPR
jgi:hypothetical protein